MVPPIRTRRQGSCQGVAEHFQQCAEFPPLRNRGLGPLVVTVLPIALAGRAAATACAAVQSAAPLFGRWRPAGLVPATAEAALGRVGAGGALQMRKSAATVATSG
jgi:hypothetical protein